MMDRRVFMKLAAGTVAYVAGGVLYCPNNFLGHRLGNAANGTPCDRSRRG